MKKEYVYGLIGILIGAVCTALIILFAKGQWDFSINIIDLLMLMATVMLSITVVYLSKSLDKKDVIRDVVVKDIEHLCDIYLANSEVISKLQKQELSLDEAKSEVNMIFHKGDLVIDMICSEFQKSFPKFHKEKKDALMNITTSYYKWLTGGDLMNDKAFTVSLNFQREHETQLLNTIKAIRLIQFEFVDKA